MNALSSLNPWLVPNHGGCVVLMLLLVVSGKGGGDWWGMWRTGGVAGGMWWRTGVMVWVIGCFIYFRKLK